MDFIFRYRAAWLSFIVCIFDLGAVAAVWLLAYVARFNGEVPPELWQSAQRHLLWILPLHGLVFGVFGLYRRMCLSASLAELLRLGEAVLIFDWLRSIAADLFQPE